MTAHARLVASATPKAAPVGAPQPDGSLLITAEELARLGNGDPKRGRRELRLMLEAERDFPIFNGPTEKPPNVRIAVKGDEKALLDLIIMDVRENATHIAPLSEDRILEHIRACTDRKGVVIGVIGSVGAPIAVSMILPAQWWFSKAWFLQEALNYVHPDHRKSNHIDDLIQFERWVGDQWSKDAGFRVYTVFSILGTRRVREKTILYKRKLRESGRLFVYPDPFVGDAS